VAAQRAQADIMADSFTRLGIDGSKLHEPAAVSAEHAGNPRRPVHLEVGTPVFLGAHGEQQWTIVGAGSGDHVQLARRTEAGTIQRTTRPWSQVIERNAQLADELDGSILAGLGFGPGGIDAVGALGRRAPVTFGTNPQPGFTFDTTWGDVLSGTELARRHPIAVRPGAEGVFGLRQLLGDERLVVSGIEQGWKAPEDANHLLIATESKPAYAREQLASLTSTQRWFHDVAGIDVWPAGRTVAVATDQPELVANASAGIGTDRTGEVAIVNQGPRTEPLRQSVLREMSGVESHLTRRYSDYIDDVYSAVETHEAGHVANHRLWGNDHSSGGLTLAAQQEAGVVDEAAADLFSAARSGKPRVGQVRSLTTLTHEYGSLDALRGTMKLRGNEFDVHAGTQLITRPMMRVLKDHGKDMLGEITGAAVHRLGQQLGSGELAAVDIPATAQALRTAAAWRLGDQSATVAHLDEAWKALKVLR
jgi:hypothetical protein